MIMIALQRSGARRLHRLLLATSSIAPGCSSSTRSSATRPRELANPAKRCVGIAGTHRALLVDMYDADAIEAINFEQLDVLGLQITVNDAERVRRADR